LLELLPDGSSPLLCPADLARANSEEGLSVLITHWTWAEPLLCSREAQDVRTMLEQKFASTYQGYHVREMLSEGFGEGHKSYCEEAGFCLLNNYHEYYKTTSPPLPEHYPYLMGVTEEEARLKFGCAIGRTFRYSPPVFFFSQLQQQILCLALTGLTNKKIAAQLIVSESLVSGQCWEMYNIVDCEKPGVLPERKENKRDKELRRALLEHIKDHPEELRPCLRRNFR